MTDAGNFSIWMVRAGRGGYLIEEFLENKIVAIGWNEIGQVSLEWTYAELKTNFKEKYPEDSDGRVNQCAGQIWRFVHDFQIGDKVVTYDSSSRSYYLGEIVSNYNFSTDYEFHHFRVVRWNELAIDRDTISTDTKNVLGSILTIFELSHDVWQELITGYETEISTSLNYESAQEIHESEKSDLAQLKDDVVSRSKEFIKDIIANLIWQDVERLVAGLLKCLGYKTRFTSKGPDLGSDIIASPDELALEEPRIKVEVKKRSKEKVGAPDIRNFIGGLRGHHKGIFVTTSGFTKEAQYEAERANFAITLIDSDWLVELIISNYETLDPEIKALVPLRKIYWPV
jgi:restriction system protein